MDLWTRRTSLQIIRDRSNELEKNSHGTHMGADTSMPAPLISTERTGADRGAFMRHQIGAEAFLGWYTDPPSGYPDFDDDGTTTITV